MKNSTQNKIRLGVFVIAGMALFTVGIYFIGEGQKLFTTSFRISAVFAHVGGLQAGNNVRLSGINVGTIDNIQMVSDTTVRVYMFIDESIRKFIRKDATASIGSDGLMGNKTLILHPGTGGQEEIEEGDVVQSLRLMDMDNIMESLKTTLDNTIVITGDLAKMTTSIQSGKWADNLDQVMSSLKTTADNAARVTADLARITDSVQTGRGAVGRLFMDPMLAQNVDSAIINLKQGSEDFKNLIGRTDALFAKNIDSTVVNLRYASEEFLLLMDKAKNSWLMWGF